MLGKNKKEEDSLPTWLIEDNSQTDGHQEEKTSLLQSGDAEKKRYTNLSDDSSDEGEVDEEQVWMDEDDGDIKENSCNFAKCCNDIFNIFSVLASFIHLAMLAAQILPELFFEFDLLEKVLRGYISVFCLVCIAIEAEWLFRDTTISNFMVRGIIYSFIGSVGMEQAVRVNKLNHAADSWAMFTALFLQIASYSETCLGCLYFIMGIFCMKIMRDKMRGKENERKLKSIEAKLNKKRRSDK